MNLIKISENVLVNPEMIETVEFRIVNGQKMLVVMIGGNQYIADVSPTDLMEELISAGIKTDNHIWQFWAG